MLMFNSRLALLVSGVMHLGGTLFSFFSGPLSCTTDHTSFWNTRSQYVGV